METLTPLLAKHLEELHLILSSLIPGKERLTFLDEEDIWNGLLMHYVDSTIDSTVAKKPQHPACFRVDINASDVCFIVRVPFEYEGRLTTATPTFAVKGNQITRTEQERWQDMIRTQLKEIGDSEFPIYQLLSIHLLPLLQTELISRPCSVDSPTQFLSSPQMQPVYHTLLTSHHLISPKKRRSLHDWSSSLSISGFAKVGYPGVIYAFGSRDDVEEFIRNVKTMQWLALKVRFVEELSGTEASNAVDNKRWSEFQKVGEVVEEMRKLKRERYIVEMGIGSIRNDG